MGKVSALTALSGDDVVATDEFYIVDTGTGSKRITAEELVSAILRLGLDLSNVPEYADQAAAASGLTGTGKLWRQTSTGLLGVTLT